MNRINKVVDSLIITQLCTCIAAGLTLTAHMISTGEILNPNWDFGIYLCIGLAMFFMMIPYIVHRGADDAITVFIKNHRAMWNRLQALDPDFTRHIDVRSHTL